MYGSGTWSSLFKTKKYYRHKQYQKKLSNHMCWLVKKHFNTNAWDYKPKLKAIIFYEEKPK